MKFRYKKLNTGSVRPIIPITLRTPKDEVDYFALVDSGADLCIFPAEIGEFLGIDIQSGRQAMVAGIVQNEQRPYYLHKISIIVGGWEYKIKAGFMPDLSRNGYGILGQHGFFDLFKSVCFKKQGGILEINP